MAQESQQDWGLSAGEVIHLAQSRGFTVSHRQLSRWQNEGLIPRPKQVHIKGVPGSGSVYPSETVGQVCALCTIAGHVRDLHRIGWYLWRLGWTVDEKYWASVFAEAIEFLDKFLGPFLEPAEDLEIAPNSKPKFELSERLLDAVQRAVEHTVSHPKAGPYKQRLGTEKFASLVIRCLDIMVGNFTRDPPIDRTQGSDDDLSLTKILERAFAQDEHHTELITKVFEFLSGTVSSGTLVDRLKGFSPNQLQFVSGEIAKNEGLPLAFMGRDDEIPKINGVPVFSLRSNIRDQAILILGWCVARQMPENVENLKTFYSKTEILC